MSDANKKPVEGIEQTKRDFNNDSDRAYKRIKHSIRKLVIEKEQGLLTVVSQIRKAAINI